MEHKKPTIENTHREIYLPGQTTKKQKEVLICLQSCGKFICNEHYITDRINYPYYLFYYVLTGKSYLNYMGEKHILKKGQAFMINCMEHQTYGADKNDPCTILYAHFEGGASQYYYEKIVENKGGVFAGFDAEIIRTGINKLMKSTESVSKYKVEELSCVITNMLNDLTILNAAGD